jgi:hypothetical protein
LAGLLTFRPLPRALSRPLSFLVLAAWVLQMAALLHHTWSAAPVALAADLSRYGTTARWKGIYYRGEKIGFSVSQTLPKDDGYEIQEDGQLQLTLMGMGTPARIKTSVRVDKAFNLRAFSFALDPGTGPIGVDGSLDGTRLLLDVRSKSGSRSETRELEQPPNLSLNLSRRLAAQGLEPGKRFELQMFDPATLRNAPMAIEVERREVLRVAGRPLPTLKLKTQFSGLTSYSWLTETGEIVREESPMGLIVVQEPRETATALAVPAEIRSDMYDAAAIVPKPAQRIDDPASVEYLKLRLSGVELQALALDGGAQSLQGDVVEMRDPEAAAPGPPDEPLEALLRPETLIESDAPEIVAEAKAANRRDAGARGAAGAPRERAAREAAHAEPALRARGAAHARRRLQRAHGAVRRAGARGRPAGADRGRSRLPARGVLLPRLARGVGRDGARARALPARRPDAEPVPRRPHAPAARPRRPRQAGGDPGPDRPRADRHPRHEDAARHGAGAGRAQPGADARDRPAGAGRLLGPHVLVAAAALSPARR